MVDEMRPLRIWLPAVRAGSGADVFVQRLAQALRRRGHEALVQWFPHATELCPGLLRHVSAPAGIDLVHAGTWQGYAFRRAGRPLVLTEHHFAGHPALQPYKTLAQKLYHSLHVNRCMRKSYQDADAVVAVSEFCAAPMRVQLARPVSVIHNWIDTDLFSPSGKARDGGSVRLLFVGNPSLHKGSDLIPQLARRLGSRYELWCMGGLRSSYSSSRMPDNVRVLPRARPEQMPGIYSSVDIVMVLSRYESFGYVALEAMACARPVIGFDVAGTAEVCANGETALLSPVDDIEALLGNIRRLGADWMMRGQLGSQGRIRAVEKFSEEKLVSCYVKLYQGLMA